MAGEDETAAKAATATAAPPAESPPPDAPRRRIPPWVWIAAGVLVAAAIAVVILVASGHKTVLPGVAPTPSTLADPVPYDGRSPGQAAEAEQRVLVQLPRPPLGD